MLCLGLLRRSQVTFLHRLSNLTGMLSITCNQYSTKPGVKNDGTTKTIIVSCVKLVVHTTYFTKPEVNLPLQVVKDKESLQFSSSASGNKKLPLDVIWEIQVRLHSMEISPLEDFFLHSKPHLPSSIAPPSGVFSCLLTPTETENGQRSTISLKGSKVKKDKKEKSLDTVIDLLTLKYTRLSQCSSGRAVSSLDSFHIDLYKQIISETVRLLVPSVVAENEALAGVEHAILSGYCNSSTLEHWRNEGPGFCNSFWASLRNVEECKELLNHGKENTFSASSS
ncbi:hypothetical protein SADUNF_Sadunf06G0188600 [Salix dunnii]|uniref:Uncharacterized protein n=1 Tax=Salix dunnii TaxID=1413687 RepID=A0A835MW43_9ROSI|nr:hypothetical protein SADUNF_Sadunf06G0188600 [Salix dunnii]